MKTRSRLHLAAALAASALVPAGRASAAGSVAAAPSTTPSTTPATAPPALPEVDEGRLERLEPASRHVDPRPVDVWLPPGYDGRTPHAVLYAHDGQMLFDARTTWNRQAWNLHTAAARLMREGRIPPTIVVGIHNAGPLRASEFFPEKSLAYLPEPVRRRYVEGTLAGRPRGEAYLRFLVEELKPAIDRRYATRPGREHTALVGSSRGGVVSVAALAEHPAVFGGAAALSVHWVGLFEPNHALPLAAFEYLRDHLGPPAGRRLYQDHGTLELDAIYAPYQAFVDEIVRDLGWTRDDAWSRVLPGTGHNETAWAARVHEALAFVLGPRAAAPGR